MDNLLIKEDEASILIFFPIKRYSLLASVEGFHFTFSIGLGVGFPNFIKFVHIDVNIFDILFSPLEEICCLPLKTPQSKGSSEL